MRCLNYAIQIERQLDLQRKNQGFLDLVQNDVNNFFKARSEDVYLKLQKPAELATSREIENAPLLLTEVRRALKAAADYFYPPTAEKVTCGDGKSAGTERAGSWRGTVSQPIAGVSGEKYGTFDVQGSASI
jgi:hypothetical protein